MRRNAVKATRDRGDIWFTWNDLRAAAQLKQPAYSGTIFDETLCDGLKRPRAMAGQLVAGGQRSPLPCLPWDDPGPDRPGQLRRGCRATSVSRISRKASRGSHALPKRR